MSGTRSRASFSGPSSSATTTSRLVHVKTALKKRQTTMNQGGTNRGNYYRVTLVVCDLVGLT